ncbi:MAG TPA: hypothetical protein VFM05_12895 [Candidatus Saccharimonadales bacterium]|nr:hypothetical protein [Candidatus Saccharimonadales bacterium]
MAFIPVPQGVQLCFDFVNDTSQNFQFCLTLKKTTGTPSITDLQNVAGAAATWWSGTLRALLDDSVTLKQTRATDLTVQGGPQHIQTVGTAGSSAGGSMPGHTALVVSQRTAKRGRSFRGRAFVGGFNSSHLADTSRATSVYAGNLVTAFAGLDTALVAVGFEVVVATKQINGVAVNPAQTNRVITYIVDTAWDSQRRRLFGRGN